MLFCVCLEGRKEGSYRIEGDEQRRMAELASKPVNQTVLLAAAAAASA
jgi:hypothetical protein